MNTTQSIVKLLGGEKTFLEVIKSDMQFFEKIHQGLPVFALEKLLESHLISPTEASHLIVPLRTYSRRKKQQRLTADESDRLARVARIISYAEEVMGERKKAHLWLRRPNPALHARLPIDMLETESGARIVETILARIEQGIYT